MAAKKRTATKKPRKPQSQVSKPALMKALTHPLRVQCLSILNEMVASPSMLSHMLNEELSKISYHVKVLRERKLIELVDTQPRRGAVEHYYRATARAVLPDSLVKQLPASTRGEIRNEVLTDIFNDVGAAVEQGTFDARDDFHMSWNPVLLDADGWTSLMADLSEFLDHIIEVQAESANRLAADKEAEPIAATITLLGFGSARGVREDRKR